MDGRNGNRAHSNTVLATVSTAAFAKAIVPDIALVPSDPRQAIVRARGDLQRAASKAELENDPLRPVLEAMSASLGAMNEVLVHADQVKQPIDAGDRADMVRQLVLACRADFVRQASLQTRRLAWLSGLITTVLLAGAIGGGYLWGRNTEFSELREASGAIRAALSDGSASAKAWADAIRRNDIVSLLSRCEGRAVWTVNGRRACTVPLWLEDAPPLKEPTPLR